MLGLFTPLGGLGVWIGLAVGLTVAAVLLLARWALAERFWPCSALRTIVSVWTRVTADAETRLQFFADMRA